MSLRNTTVLFLLASSTSAFAVSTYDAASDFDASMQGNGGWTYLYDADGSGSYDQMSFGSTFWGFGAMRDPSCNEAHFALDAGGLVTHPADAGGCAGASTLAWEAPMDGVATISLDAGTVNAACSDGTVDIELVDEDGYTLWSQLGTTHLASYSYDGDVDMLTGDHLYLRVSAGDGGAFCDTTGIAMGVTFYETDNYSFESAAAWDAVVSGHSWNHSVVGWTLGPNSFGGTQSPSSAQFNGGASDGDQDAWLNEGTLSQEVTTARAGVTYVLTADAGWRNDLPVPGEGTMSLAVDGVLVASTALSGLVQGEWVAQSLDYTASAADEGKTLSVIFSHDGSWPNQGQLNIDNVQLSY